MTKIKEYRQEAAKLTGGASIAPLFRQQAEADEAVKVLVFKSADADYFISHGSVA